MDFTAVGELINTYGVTVFMIIWFTTRAEKKLDTIASNNAVTNTNLAVNTKTLETLTTAVTSMTSTLTSAIGELTRVVSVVAEKAGDNT